MSNNTINPRREGGWGWMVVIGSHIIQVIASGNMGISGLLIAELVAEFQESFTSTSWVVSLAPVLAGILGPVAAVLSVRYGHRHVCFIGGLLICIGTFLSSFANKLLHLYLTLGIVAGIGGGLTFAPCNMIVGIYFKERFTLAMALASAGFSMGLVLLPPLFAIMVSQYGWRSALFIASAINLNVCVCACLFRPLPRSGDQVSSKWVTTPEEGAGEYVQNNRSGDLHHVAPNRADIVCAPINEEMRPARALTNDISVSHRASEPTNTCGSCCDTASKATGIPELCQSLHYPIAMLTTFIIAAVNVAITVYIVPRTLHLGYSSNQAATLITIFGIGSLIGRFISGVLVDRNYASTQTVMILGLASVVVELSLTPVTNSYALLVGFSFTVGISVGIINPLCWVISREVSPSWLLAPALGFTSLAFAAGSTFGGVLGGWLYDVSGDYKVIFYTCGAIMCLNTILFIPTLRWLNKVKADRAQSKLDPQPTSSG